MSCLELVEAEAGYGRAKVIKGINLCVDKGKVALLVGPNGSGKSTLAKVILGLVPLFKGSVFIQGKDISGMKPEKIVKMGVAFVPEGRHLFWEMSVKENLLMGGIYLNDSKIEEKLEKVYQLFPILKERSRQIAGTLSGGEQQMLAIARALVGDVRVLILDEPCNGIAAGVVKEILEVILQLKQTGCAILLIDQTTEAVEIADYAYAMRTGEIVAQGKPEDIFSRKNMKRLFLI
ncbi:ABC transporter ATP-binding protein [Candidatus Aerophobetes bacterium]|uniref:ABC transporter ATP-binding protein n=1 Tax=Aerophobetes bacterium TaxID=2030807 RepID=A0A662DA71_UNCAE|nr:MAG: ABC transporter ATP-binding protein [Candidatus Aerophobetes bacterium]